MRRDDGRQTFFSSVAPMRTEPATCAEVECEQYREGFVMALPLNDPLTDGRASVVRKGERRAAEFIVRQVRDGDWFTELVAWGRVGSSEVKQDALAAHVKATDTPSRVFAFPPGEECFREHRVGVDHMPVLAHEQHGQKPRRVGRSEFVERLHEETETVTELRTREGVAEMREAIDGL